MAATFLTYANLDFMRGEHKPTDTYKLALYTTTSGKDHLLKEYTTDNESSGAGYTAGGITLAGYETNVDETNRYAWMKFNDVVLDGATLTAACGVVYNATNGKAIYLDDFGRTYTVTNGKLTIRMPNTSDNAIITIGG